MPNGLWYKDRRWANVFPGNATFTADTFNYLDPRTGFFTVAYSTSPGMAVDMVNVGAKYPVTFVDAQGEFLRGSNSYKLNLPKDVPAALFWSVTVYDPVTGSGLDNGQAFPSLNTMDKPVLNADGSTDIYLGPNSPGDGKNWLRTLPDKGFFVILRLYGPKQEFFDRTWKPGDIEKIDASASAAAGAKITEEYAQLVARDAFFWAWPLVNMYNRRLAFANVPRADAVRSDADGTAQSADHADRLHRTGGAACRLSQPGRCLWSGLAGTRSITRRDPGSRLR